MHGPLPCNALFPNPRLLFEVRPKAIRLHLPDARLLVSGLPECDRDAAHRLVTPACPKRRRRLLRDLLRAQQPPGRVGRRVAALRRAAAKLAWSAVAFVLGYAVGIYRASLT